MNLRRYISFGFVSVTLVAPQCAVAKSYTFTKIADTSGPFSAFSTGTPDSGLPSINADGYVAYFAALDAGGSGIYRLAGPMDIVPVGIDYVTVAGTGLTYSGFARGLPVINNLNQVAFWASRTAGGVAVYRNGASVASSDNGFSELNDSPALHPNTSLVAVRGSKVIVVPFSTPGIWTGSTAGTYTEVVTGTSGLSSDGPSINGLGHVAWVGTYGTTGVHVASGGVIRDWATTAGIFSAFDPQCAINTPQVVAEPVKVAFLANLDAGGSGIYTAHIGPAGFVITPIATDPVISVFSRPSINSKGNVVFRRVVPVSDDALFTGPDLTADRVIGDSDALDGRTVSDVRTSRHALNDRGQIAFRATFTDGTSGIYRANLCAADVTGNHVIDIDDLVSVITSWGMCPMPCPPHCPADIDHNCMVNIDDLVAVITGWGGCP